MTDHDVGMILSQDGWISPYWPMGAMAIFALVYFLIADVMNDVLAKLNFKAFRIGENLNSLEEGLLNYWSAISKQDKKWIMKEEYYRNHALNMPMMTDEQN